MFGSAAFSASSLSANLSAARHRLRIHQDAARNQRGAQRAEVAALVKARNFDSARVRAEALLLQQRRAEAEEVLELMCALLHERVDVIAGDRLAGAARAAGVPAELRDSITTLVWAAPRVDVWELQEVREQLRRRYAGDKELRAVAEGAAGALPPGVNEDVGERLVAGGPLWEARRGDLLRETLEDVAKEFGLDFDAARDLASSRIGLAAPAAAPAGAGAGAGAGSGPSSAAAGGGGGMVGPGGLIGGPPFSPAALSSNLAAARQRFRIRRDGATNAQAAQGPEIAALLRKGLFDSARLHAEALVLQRRRAEAEEVLELMCALLYERVDVIAGERGGGGGGGGGGGEGAVASFVAAAGGRDEL
jgi:hypothetical protein